MPYPILCSDTEETLNKYLLNKHRIGERRVRVRVVNKNLRISDLGLCGSDGKESACSAGDLGSVSRLGRFSWRRAWPLLPVFLPGESHGQRSLAGYSPWGHQELDTTECLALSI